MNSVCEMMSKEIPMKKQVPRLTRQLQESHGENALATILCKALQLVLSQIISLAGYMESDIRHNASPNGGLQGNHTETTPKGNLALV